MVLRCFCRHQQYEHNINGFAVWGREVDRLVEGDQAAGGIATVLISTVRNRYAFANSRDAELFPSQQGAINALGVEI